jgi:hypothetical protein
MILIEQRFTDGIHQYYGLGLDVEEEEIVRRILGCVKVETHLQVLADAGQVNLHRDIETIEDITTTDTYIPQRRKSTGVEAGAGAERATPSG